MNTEEGKVGKIGQKGPEEEHKKLCTEGLAYVEPEAMTNKGGDDTQESEWEWLPSRNSLEDTYGQYLGMP